ncbi:transcriptional repressor LexA [Povalibacter sp.]|uniref:transcriptional repressor LexA n=1 Tax=Povalibacter sp. TaxID=1962978 RepID=UPI002F4151AA
MPSLTSKQLEVLAFIQKFMGTHGLPPTRGEIAAGLGLKNRQGIDQHLRALAAKEAIELTPGISRGIRLPGTQSGLHTRAVQADGLPLLGRIAAGSPILATGNIEDRIRIEPALFRPRAHFLLRVRSDSMKDADILDRDLLAVHQTTEVHDGQIVVARIGEEATVKYYRRLGQRVLLEPANAAYQPIEIDLSETEAAKIITARLSRPFISIEDFSARALIPKRPIRVLANGGAFRSLSDHGNVAFWDALGIERLPGILEALPAPVESIHLPVPSEWEEIQRDYQQLGFSSGRHPLALMRSNLRRLGLSSRQELNAIRSGRTVTVGGLVTHLQHPQTANGVVFASLEDEIGINNIIFWPTVFEAHRHRILQTKLMIVEGELQSQEGVVHVVAQRVHDFSHWVRSLPRNSRDFH